MPETRYVEEYDNEGNVINRIPYEVSDEQLHLENLEKENNEAHMLLLQAYRNFDTLTAAQVKQVVRALLRDYIVSHKDWYLGVL